MIKENTQDKQILVDMDNYNALKQTGQTGDSFNDIIELINESKKDANHKCPNY